MNRKGFTLIELLVVIAIIGLLSTLAIVALGTARLKSRDARRVADLKSIQTALELYYSDKGGYPVTSSIQLGDSTHVCLDSNGFNVAGACSSPYLANIPKDPKGGYYSYTGIANNYKVLASLEGTVNNLAGQISVSPNSGVAADQVALSLPFDKPGCYPSGSPLGTLGEAVTTNRATTATYVDANGVVRTCQNNELRVTPSGALIEQGATNLIMWSDQLENLAWGKGGGNTITPNTDVSPDGTTSADTIVRGTGGGNSVYYTFTGTAAVYTASMWVKAGTTAVAYYNFYNSGPGFPAATCQIISGPGSLGANPSAGGLCVVSGLSTVQWTRISVTATLTASAIWNVSLYPETSGVGTAGLTFKYWGAQVELGPYATSYIPTAGSTAPRNADAVSVAWPVTPLNDWCLAGTFVMPWQVASSRLLFGLGNALQPNSADGYTNSGNVVVRKWDSSGAHHNSSAGVGLVDWSSHRIGLCSSGSASTGASDGVVANSDGPGLWSASPATLYLGQWQAGTQIGGTVSNFLVCNSGTYGQSGCQ